MLILLTLNNNLKQRQVLVFDFNEKLTQQIASKVLAAVIMNVYGGKSLKSSGVYAEL